MVGPVLAYGQADMATIVGRVFDSSGAGVTNAAVTIVNLGSNLKTAVKTNIEGDYVATPLRIGNYSINIEVQGFKTATRTGVVLRVQDRLRVDFVLQVGSISEQITVTDTPPLLQTESSALGDVVQSQQITDLPLNGRDYTQLIALTTGVTKIAESGNGLYGAASATNGNAGGSFAVNGTRGLLNNFLLDGIDNNSNDGGQNVLRTNLDAIEEFKVQTSNYSAEFGRSGGAVVNATIKSGTNSFHGTAFEFLRNSALDARGFFEPPGPKAPFRQNIFGGTFGGPIKRNKLFFFGGYQGTRIATTETDKSIVPTADEINGNFSAVGTIYDPGPGCTPTSPPGSCQAVRTAFPNNTIPANRIDPISHNIAMLYPAPNAAPADNRYNYISNNPGRNRIDQGDVRGDYTISEKQQLFGRFSLSHTNRFQQPPLPGLADGGGSIGGNRWGNYFDRCAIKRTGVWSETAFLSVSSRTARDQQLIWLAMYSSKEALCIGGPHEPMNRRLGISRRTISSLRYIIRSAYSQNMTAVEQIISGDYIGNWYQSYREQLEFPTTALPQFLARSREFTNIVQQFNSYYVLRAQRHLAGAVTPLPDHNIEELEGFREEYAAFLRDVQPWATESQTTFSPKV